MTSNSLVRVVKVQSPELCAVVRTILFDFCCTLLSFITIHKWTHDLEDKAQPTAGLISQTFMIIDISCLVGNWNPYPPYLISLSINN